MPWALFFQLVLLLVLVWAITCSIIDTVMRNRSINRVVEENNRREAAQGTIYKGSAEQL